MNEQEIIEGNKLLAEFMGWEYFEKSKVSVEQYPFGGHDYFEELDVWIKNPTDTYRELLCHCGYYYIDDKLERSDLFEDWNYGLYFHSEWKWIMPVVEKIRDIGHHVEIVYTTSNWLKISRPVYRDIIGDTSDTILILESEETEMLQLMWQACVKFVEYYNQANEKKD